MLPQHFFFIFLDYRSKTGKKDGRCFWVSIYLSVTLLKKLVNIVIHESGLSIFHPVSFKPPGKWLFCVCIILFYTCIDLRDIKSRHSWIQPSEIDLTNKIGKTVTGEVRHFLPSLSQGNDAVSKPRGPNIKFAGAIKPCGSQIVFPCYVWFQVILHALWFRLLLAI